MEGGGRLGSAAAAISQARACIAVIREVCGERDLCDERRLEQTSVMGRPPFSLFPGSPHEPAHDHW